ncbi:MAG: acylphosphatase [Chitinophagaceae bacterium]|nr:acylphosphatase [Chitinophagaceae bacterium]
MKQTISIIVSGKVQGVFYRQSTKEKALELGITGYVKNLPDGSVYVIATGTDEQLAALKTWCKKGPPRAIVDTIITEELPLHKFIEFIIER